MDCAQWGYGNKMCVQSIQIIDSLLVTENVFRFI